MDPRMCAVNEVNRKYDESRSPVRSSCQPRCFFGLRRDYETAGTLSSRERVAPTSTRFRRVRLQLGKLWNAGVDATNVCSLVIGFVLAAFAGEF